MTRTRPFNRYSKYRTIQQIVRDLRTVLREGVADKEIAECLEYVNWKKVSKLKPRCRWRCELESAQLLLF